MQKAVAALENPIVIMARNERKIVLEAREIVVATKEHGPFSSFNIAELLLLDNHLTQAFKLLSHLKPIGQSVLKRHCP